MFGRPNVAEEGKLWIVVAGADGSRRTARPLLEPLSRGISVVGKEPRQAHAVKLGGNFLISAMIHSLGEAFVYAEAQGIEPEVFLETVNSALFQSPFYAAYGKVMLHPPEQPGATIDLGAKDLRLLREAAASRNTRLEPGRQHWPRSLPRRRQAGWAAKIGPSASTAWRSGAGCRNDSSTAALDDRSRSLFKHRTYSVTLPVCNGSVRIEP